MTRYPEIKDALNDLEEDLEHIARNMAISSSREHG